MSTARILTHSNNSTKCKKVRKSDFLISISTLNEIFAWIHIFVSLSNTMVKFGGMAPPLEPPLGLTELFWYLYQNF